MNNTAIKELKPDFDEAALRWEAFWNRDIIARPILTATIERDKAYDYCPHDGYYERIYGDLEEIVNNKLHNARNVVYLGEAIPGTWTSLGTHEIATYCGYGVKWAGVTNWCERDERELSEILPLVLDENCFMYRRELEFLDKLSEIAAGRLISYGFDFHSNLDLLLSVRGDENLCYDTFDCPEQIDRGLEDSCTIFAKMWKDFTEHARSEEFGYYFDQLSEKPTTSLACDFAALISEEMFRRFAVPALTYESEVIGKRSIFHWDGPDALKHLDAITGIPNFHTIRYVPNHYETHTQLLDVYKECQRRGKSIAFTGSVEEIKNAHRVLKPNLTCYHVSVETEQEFRDLEKWLTENT